ncbi:MAG: DNA-binding protein [Clostridiaceae bacterium]|nr:DNA-binding protein [Clostridiaceae bacterium]
MQKEASNRIGPVHTDVCLWLDYYGELLSARQKEIVSLYYDEDLSLSEIASLTGLTRQGIHDRIRRGVANLESYESALALVERDLKIENILQQSLRFCEKDDSDRVRDCLDKLWKILKPGEDVITDVADEGRESRGDNGII